MKALNHDNQLIELTTGESKIYSHIADSGDEYEERPTLHPSDIGHNDFTKLQVAGFISSLFAKDVIRDIENPNGETVWQTTATFEDLNP